jgi:hypothetical protein|tara:strand:- start:232 stop:456 length:225 start_codon:yes stop_codon:yes gene_type:complete
MLSLIPSKNSAFSVPGAMFAKEKNTSEIHSKAEATAATLRHDHSHRMFLPSQMKAKLTEIPVTPKEEVSSCRIM